MKILYFSWIKDKLGKPEDNITINDNIKTIDDLISLLKNMDDKYNNVFADVS